MKRNYIIRWRNEVGGEPYLKDDGDVTWTARQSEAKRFTRSEALAERKSWNDPRLLSVCRLRAPTLRADLEALLRFVRDFSVTPLSERGALKIPADALAVLRKRS